MDEVRTITCTVCPMGCSIRVTLRDGEAVAFEGHQCKRGPVFAKDEVRDPRRMLTTTVRIRGCTARSVPARAAAPIPRDRMMAAMAQVRGLTVDAPVVAGQVLLADLAGTGIALVATGSAASCAPEADPEVAR